MESQRLVNAFESELQLRKTKHVFLYTAIKKLEKIKRNRMVTQKLIEKEQQLQQLQEGAYDDLARLEEMKTDIEMDTTFLETIDQLSSKLDSIQHVDEAKILNKELIRMTKGLR